MVKKLEEIQKKIRECTGEFTITLRYADGGCEVEHDLRGICSCGYKRHYTSPNGDVYLSLDHYNNHYDC